MEELKHLAELQGGVLYLEQVEEWLEKVVEELEEYKKQWMDSDYLDGIDEIIDIVRKGGVE